ncbi:hypothetical protein [Desulfosediminicola sp.]|uniref:hypothetical protein n=1 Tax=Desulfosediminicola sp. TaxID=2886825 RepID=UPI003AF27ACB
MEKFCVFCGEKPQSKNLEHIIPHWLIRMTGDPKRKINLGLDWNKKDTPQRMYPYDQFKFPSCENCNTKFGRLESKVKPIVEKLVNAESITNDEVSYFLDWLDKVRVGLWLAYLYLDKNMSSIRPRYHITKRTGLYDRMVAVYKCKDSLEGVGFIGANTPSFQYSPTCFTLVINKYHFFNISRVFLFSGRLGFPYATRIIDHPDKHKSEVEVVGGRERVMYPIIRKSIKTGCTQLYQPMFSRDELPEDLIHEHYSTDYVQNNSLNWENGVGDVFIQNNGEIVKFPQDTSSKKWEPNESEEREELSRKLAIQTFEFQNHLLERDPFVDGLDKQYKQQIKKHIRHAKTINNYMIRIANKGPAKRSRRTR